jgi:tetratricopeptide (TPR) repeat protein
VAVREISLSEVRADGWFTRVGQGSASFTQLLGLVGERPFAYSLIVGVQITSVLVDRRQLDSSLVSFVVGDDDAEHKMPLGEFKRRVTLALLEEEGPRPSIPEAHSIMDVHAFLGPRLVLLAALDNVKLDTLLLGDDGEVNIRFEIEDRSHEVPLADLEEGLLDRVREDASALAATTKSSFDLTQIPEAEARSSRGDWDGTIELLASWAGPLSMIIRTAEGQKLTAEVRSQLARALGLLGTAYAKRREFEQGETVLRLGIQWGQDGPATAELFYRLGLSAFDREESGEAIGHLRRALSLGHSRPEIMPKLARAFADRGRFVAAMTCVDEANALGCADEEIAETRARCASALGHAWETFRTYVPLASTSSDTLRPASPDGGEP